MFEFIPYFAYFITLCSLVGFGLLLYNTDNPKNK
jgi:hypothetical protein